jgi:hypothetical protein
MAGLADIPGVVIHGKGSMDFQLPVGYVDVAGKLHDCIVIHEMTGAEDDMLGNDDLPIGERVSNVLSSCIDKLGDIEDKDTIRRAVSDDLEGAGLPITEQDRIAAMIFLRRVSIGDVYKFERRCPRCGEMASHRTIDLRTLKIDKAASPEKRRVSVTLPRSGQTAIIKVLTAKDAIALGRLRPTQKDLKSLAISSRVESLDGVALDDPRKALSAIKALPQKDRNYIRQVYNAMETAVETDVDVECRNPVCHVAWKFPLDVGQGFFLDLEEKVSGKELNWL